MIVPIYERDNIPAAQAFDCFQYFCSEYLGMLGYDMNLDVIGARPSKGTEWALASDHVFVSDVSLELLNPFEDPATVYANRLRLATAHCRMCPVIYGGLESEMPCISVELGLVSYGISVHSNDDSKVSVVLASSGGKFGCSSIWRERSQAST